MINKIIVKLIRKVSKIFYYQIRNLVLPYKTNRILIARFDGVGDYILFRNFIKALKLSEKYNDYSISFLGRDNVKELAEYFDKEFFDRFYFIPSNDFFELQNKITKRLYFILRFKFRCFDIIINPTHSRIYTQDVLLSELGAKKMIGSIGDSVNFQSLNEKNISDRLYFKLIHTHDISTFEFVRNKFFFENLLNEDLNSISLFFDKMENRNRENLIVINPGAGSKQRQWNPVNFSRLINLILRETGEHYRVILIGSKDELNIGDEIMFHVNENHKIENYIGKLDFVESIKLISKSEIVISNETSTIHISAAVDTKAICLSNGNHFGRFNPYPLSVSEKIVTIYPNIDFYNNELKDKMIELTKIQSTFDINEIQPESVFLEFKQKLIICYNG